jgi:hypothetical protein
LPASLRTTAEVIMAAFDRREVRLRAREKENSFPEGQLVVPLPPENGLNDHAKKAGEDIRKHLAKKMNHGIANDFIRDINGYFYSRFVEPETGASVHEESMKKRLANDEINHKMEVNKCKFYVLFHPYKDNEELAAMQTIAETIKKDYPELRCVVLKNDQELEKNERNRYASLRDIIPIKGPSSS